MDQTRFPTGSPSGQYIYRNGPKRAGLLTASDQTVRAVHSCNNWFKASVLNDRPDMKLLF